MDLKANFERVIENSRNINQKATQYVAKFGHMDRPTVVYLEDESGTLYVGADGRLTDLIGAKAFKRSEAHALSQKLGWAFPVEILEAHQREIERSAQLIEFSQLALSKI